MLRKLKNVHFSTKPKNIGYEEYMGKIQKKPSEDVINNMEKVFSKATVLKNHQKPLNNLNYKSFPYGA